MARTIGATCNIPTAICPTPRRPISAAADRRGAAFASPCPGKSICTTEIAASSNNAIRPCSDGSPFSIRRQKAISFNLGVGYGTSWAIGCRRARGKNRGTQDIHYINAHGTATLAGDIEETKAIKQVFGTHAANLPVSSTKSMHGHLMGAAGALEFMAAVLALQHNALPPTINLHVPDPECDLDYVPNHGRTDVKLNAVMSNSFAFGGTNAVLIAKRFDS